MVARNYPSLLIVTHPVGCLVHPLDESAKKWNLKRRQDEDAACKKQAPSLDFARRTCFSDMCDF
jgi:hypothetical protein